ncbi:MAG: hypothetical protein IK066_07275 [Kiritimatiellae bacterium]|nr:hypothetical protein [Kiritimatiellia bacterium]
MHNLARLLGRSALVVKEVRIDESAECQVKVVARKGGLISWLLSLLRINSTFTLSVFADRIESEEGSFSGLVKTVVPLSALDTYTSGFTKPAILLVLAVLLVGASVWAAAADVPGYLAGIFLLVALLFVLRYFLRKCLLLSFTTNGANGILFLFKRSVIEGVDVDEALADRIANIVKRNYLAQTQR